jgi:hypothetical protein
MDRTGAYSPIDRRTYPSHIALRDSAVLKSWSFPQTGNPTRAGYTYSIVKTPLKLKWFTEEFCKPAALPIRRRKRPNYSRGHQEFPAARLVASVADDRKCGFTARSSRPDTMSGCLCQSLFDENQWQNCPRHWRQSRHRQSRRIHTGLRLFGTIYRSHLSRIRNAVRPINWGISALLRVSIR